MTSTATDVREERVQSPTTHLAAPLGAHNYDTANKRAVVGETYVGHLRGAPCSGTRAYLPSLTCLHLAAKASGYRPSGRARPVRHSAGRRWPNVTRQISIGLLQAQQLLVHHHCLAQSTG